MVERSIEPLVKFFRERGDKAQLVEVREIGPSNEKVLFIVTEDSVERLPASAGEIPSGNFAAVPQKGGSPYLTASEPSSGFFQTAFGAEDAYTRGWDHAVAAGLVKRPVQARGAFNPWRYVPGSDPAEVQASEDLDEEALWSIAASYWDACAKQAARLNAKIEQVASSLSSRPVADAERSRLLDVLGQRAKEVQDDTAARPAKEA